MTFTAVAVPALSKHMEAEMFDKKEDNSTSTTDVFRPAKGSAKVVIGHGVQITGEIKKSDEVQIDGEADVTMKTDNFDKQATNHLSFYESFLSLSKIVIAGIVTILILMAVFLL